MRKIFTLFVASAAFGAYAQSSFVVSPAIEEGVDIAMLGERISPNLKYVAGTSNALQVPLMWNTETDEVKMIIEEETAILDDGEGGTFEMTQTKTGSFHAVNDEGIAVGSLTDINYIAHAVMYNFSEGKYITLYEEAEDAGNDAYAMTADGSLIVGFHFDEAWVTHACIWTDGGKVRTDLEWPNEEDLGVPYDYVSARYVSADGSVIAGYAQDNNSGAWIALIWNRVEGVDRNGDGLIDEIDMYVPQVISKPYYQTLAWDETTYEPIIPENPLPYQMFEPTSLSANGEWLTLMVKAFSDPNDWDNMPFEEAARMNLKSGELEVLDHGFEGNGPELFGIASDGTAVGRMSGEFDWETFNQPVDGVIWPAGSKKVSTLAELYAEDEYVASMSASALCDITADGKTVLGYANDEDMTQTTFYVKLPDNLVAIERVDSKQAAKVAFDLSGRKAAADAKGILVVDGEKVVRL